MDTDHLLPADPTRDLTPAQLAEAELTQHGQSYAYGMWSPAGAARLERVITMTEAALDAGLDRPTCLAVLHGGLLRMERDGHSEVSDTVVRESFAMALDAACERAGHEPFTDSEAGEVALMLSLHSMDGMVAGWRKGLAER